MSAIQHGLGCGQRSKAFQNLRVVLERQAIRIFLAEGGNKQLFAQAIANPGPLTIELRLRELDAAFDGEGAELGLRASG